MKREARIKIARELVRIANDLVPQKRTRKADVGDYDIVVNTGEFFTPANGRVMPVEEWEKALEYIDEAYWDARKQVNKVIHQSLKRREKAITRDGLKLK
jgi:hypothetical protein